MSDAFFFCPSGKILIKHRKLPEGATEEAGAMNAIGSSEESKSMALQPSQPL